MSLTFKHYRIGARIGSGGMASVFTATDSVLGREVAIKVLHPALAMDESYVGRFESEARQAAAQNHPNLVTIFDFGSENDTYFIVMELIKGLDLGAALKRQHQVPLEVGLAILEEAALGLDALHRSGVIHRDIKPANILLSLQGQVKIVDFGLTKQVGEMSGLALTATGTVLGTAYYMSPEQSVGKKLDTGSDVFSLGVVAYEMLSGRRPFEGESYSEIVDRLTTYSPPPVSSIIPTIAPPFDALIERMLAKEVGRRPINADEVLKELERCISSMPDSATYLQRRKSYIRGFVADPEGYARQHLESAIKRSLDRGRLYSTQGRERLGDAIAEFESTLRMDPENAIAHGFLARLRRSASHALPGASRQNAADKPGEPSSASRPDEPLSPTRSGAESTVVPPTPPIESVSATAKPGPRWGKTIAWSAAALLAILVPTTFWLSSRLAPPRVPLQAASLPPSLGDATPPVSSDATARPPAPTESTAMTTPIQGGSLPAKARTIVVALESLPTGATVSYRRKGTQAFVRSGLVTPCSLELSEPGTWELRLQKPGFEPLAQSWRVEESRALPPFKLLELDTTASLTVSSEPEGARVDFPGMPGTWLPEGGGGTTPRTYRNLRAGGWKLRFRLNGYDTLDTTVALRSQSESAVRAVLRRKTSDVPALRPAKGLLVVRLATQFAISVDGGRFIPVSRYEWSDSLAAGTHRIVVRRKDTRELEFKVTIAPGQVNTQRPRFPE